MTAPLRQNGRLVTTIVGGCTRKSRYSDEHGARAIGQIVEGQSGVPLFIYQCGICRGWHLTKCRQKNPEMAVGYPLKTAAR